MTRKGSLFRPRRLAEILLGGALLAGPAMAAGAPNDQENDMSYMWDLTELYPTPEAWSEAHDTIRAAWAKARPRCLPGWTLLAGCKRILHGFMSIRVSRPTKI